MTRSEAWVLVGLGACLMLCAQSLYHALLDVAEAIEEIAIRAEAPTIPSTSIDPDFGKRVYHSAASTDARRPGKDTTTGEGRHAAD